MEFTLKIKRSLKRARRSVSGVQRLLSRMNARGKVVLAGVLAGLVLLPVAISLALASGKREPANVMDVIGEITLSNEYADAGTVYITPQPTEPTQDDTALMQQSPQTFGAAAALPEQTPKPDRTLKRGMENEEVQRLQERLMDLGFLDLDESTQYFGPATEEAVKLFQRQVSFSERLDATLTQDGIAGEKTLDLVHTPGAPRYVVLEGMEGDDVTQMQLQLKELGYMSATTGYYGEKTVAAIKAFQGRNKLSSDGKAGEYTFNLLYSPNAVESETLGQSKRTTASISKMIDTAKKQLGDRYVLGARGPDRFDCSGLVYYCLNEAGSNRRRLNAAGYSQVSDWEKISSMNSLKKGDLVFFYNNAFSKVGHVGIVIGNGEMVDASSGNGKVVRRSYTTSYWKKHFVCGRRPW